MDAAGVLPRMEAVASAPFTVTASVSATHAAPNTLLFFSANATNASDDPVEFNWTFTPGVWADGPVASFEFNFAGDYPVQLTANDSMGNYANTTLNLTITAVSISAGPLPHSVAEGDVINFSASASGGAGAPYNFTWLFGDGGVGYGPNVQHAFRAAGAFTPVLIVTDRLGASSTSPLGLVNVTAPPSEFGWLTGWVVVAIGVGVALIVAGVAFARRRSSERKVPPTPPSPEDID